MHVNETESLKRCPFCGGKAELIKDQHPLNETYNRYRVACTECHIAGGTFMDGPTMQTGDKPPGFITAEEATSKAIEAWNHRAQPDIMEIADDVYELNIAAERAAMMADELQQEYFGNAEPCVCTLRAEYDRGRILSNVVFDYAYKTREIALALEDKL